MLRCWGAGAGQSHAEVGGGGLRIGGWVGRIALLWVGGWPGQEKLWNRLANKCPQDCGSCS